MAEFARLLIDGSLNLGYVWKYLRSNLEIGKTEAIFVLVGKKAFPRVAPVLL